jgi:hypothetical protein
VTLPAGAAGSAPGRGRLTGKGAAVSFQFASVGLDVGGGPRPGTGHGTSR